MTIKQLFKVDRAMVSALQMTAVIVMIVAVLVFVGLFIVGGFLGVLLMIVGTILTTIGSINYLEYNG